MGEPDLSSLSRPVDPTPAFVLDALTEARRLREFRLRPRYQQHDAAGWINRAQRAETKTKRLGQMLDELERGNFTWRWGPSRGRNGDNRWWGAMPQTGGRGVDMAKARYRRER